jgi:hypothetical protein
MNQTGHRCCQGDERSYSKTCMLLQQVQTYFANICVCTGFSSFPLSAAGRLDANLPLVSDSSCGQQTIRALLICAWHFKKGNKFVQDEVDDAVLWVKAAFALIVGVVWGMVPMEGAGAIASGVAAVAFASLLFVRKVLRVDEELFGGSFSLLQHGAAPAFSTFLVRDC